MVTILVTETTRLILEVNVMSQSNFSVRVNGQTKKWDRQMDLRILETN